MRFRFVVPVDRSQSTVRVLDRVSSIVSSCTVVLRACRATQVFVPSTGVTQLPFRRKYSGSTVDQVPFVVGLESSSVGHHGL